MSHLIKPHITEKTMLDATRGVFTFVAKTNASKSQIKVLIQDLFKVNVIKVNTSTTKQALKKTGKRRLLSPSTPTKFARVWLKSGESISLFDIKEEN